MRGYGHYSAMLTGYLCEGAALTNPVWLSWYGHYSAILTGCFLHASADEKTGKGRGAYVVRPLQICVTLAYLCMDATLTNTVWL